MSDLCEPAIEAAEAMLALHRREAEYRAAKRAVGPPRWNEAARKGAARRVRDAGVRVQERLDSYASAKGQEHHDQPERRNA